MNNTAIIKTLATPEFLTTLLEVAKRYGWSGDYIEISQFVSDIYDVADKKLSDEDLEPYEEVIEEKAFMTVDEIVADLKNNMDDKGIEAWTSIKKEDLIKLHSTVGRTIRNTYRLWEVNHPAVPEWVHPDEASMKIMEKFWDTLHQK